MKLARLTLNESRARAVLARQGHALSLDLGVRWHVAFQPLPLSEAPARWADAWTLQAEWGGARFALRVPEAALTLWAEGSTGAPLALSALPPELLALALQQVWQQLAAALVPLRRGTPRLASVRAGTEVAGLPHRWAVSLQRDDGQAAFDAEIATDALGLLLAAGALAQRPAALAEPLLHLQDQLPLRCRLALGRSVLPAAQVRGLRLGDVVLVQERWLEDDADGTTLLLLTTQGTVCWHVRLTEHRIHLIQAWNLPVTQTQTHTHTAGTDEEQPGSLDNVPVTLGFDIGELTVPLAELRQWVVGHSFDLGRPLAGAVQVRANGMLLGVGELVEIDGRLGVAMTRLHGTADDKP